MVRLMRTVFVVVAAMFAVYSVARGANADLEAEGRWKIFPSTESGVATLQLIWPDGSTWKKSMPLTELGGSPFRYDQDAGVFEFTGSSREGTFTFTPKRKFASTLQHYGIAKASDITDRDLMNLAFGGFSEKSIREFAALGLKNITKDEMMDLAVQQVTPEFVKSLRARGVKGADTVHGVVEIRMFGFPQR